MVHQVLPGEHPLGRAPPRPPPTPACSLGPVQRGSLTAVGPSGPGLGSPSGASGRLRREGGWRTGAGWGGGAPASFCVCTRLSPESGQRPRPTLLLPFSLCLPLLFGAQLASRGADGLPWGQSSTGSRNIEHLLPDPQAGVATWLVFRVWST